MRIVLQGGFGEKGRTSIGVECGGRRLVLDAGIKVGAAAADYFPRLAWPAATIDALFVTHAHEDHVGAAGWLMEQGFRGTLHMTAETRREAPDTISQYAGADHARLFAEAGIRLFESGETIRVGDVTVATGATGHVAGGVWFAVTGCGQTLLYCGDVVPASRVFAMDAPPPADLVLLDASYGGDDGAAIAPADAIAAWIAARPRGALLPTPLSGRSLELIAAMPGAFAIHQAMLPGLHAQLEARSAFRPGIADDLAARIAAAAIWPDDGGLPPLPLLCHDGMGAGGPAATLLPRAAAAGHPVLLTGHLPDGSPGHAMHAAGKADWIRMPTHPVAAQNRALWQAVGAPRALGHSCGPVGLDALARHVPDLSLTARTGDAIALEAVR